MPFKLPKFVFPKFECEWLGHKIISTGITPPVRKTDPTDDLKPPRTLSQLKFFMGSIHSLNKHLAVLADHQRRSGRC